MQWNPWHGCKKISAGCQHCYVYRIDSGFDRDASVVYQTKDFNLPLKKNRKGHFTLKSGETVYTCFSSDFFLDQADEWRTDAWKMILLRQDLHFFIITKRIDRFFVNLPADWGAGYPNVTICCTCENQDRADYRLPIYANLPIRHKSIICEPLLERICISEWIGSEIEQVVVGGESGTLARLCNYDWVLDLRRQCMEKNVSFRFKQTGARFQKDDRLYIIKRKYQHLQALKAGINFNPLR